MRYGRGRRSKHSLAVAAPTGAAFEATKNTDCLPHRSTGSPHSVRGRDHHRGPRTASAVGSFFQNEVTSFKNIIYLYFYSFVSARVASNSRMADFRLERARRSYRSRRTSSNALSCRIIANFSSSSSGLQLITLLNISASEAGNAMPLIRSINPMIRAECVRTESG
jgi:hypothetical protein